MFISFNDFWSYHTKKNGEFRQVFTFLAVDFHQPLVNLIKIFDGIHLKMLDSYTVTVLVEIFNKVWLILYK